MTPQRLVWLATFAYALAYFALGWDRYATYHSGSDLGLFTQTVASAFAGFRNTTEGANHFTVHFSPLLYAFAPVVLVTHSALALVAVQALAGALVAPPLFAFARRRMPERLALGVALVALVYPPLAGVTFADFHENGLVPAATLWLVWAYDARRWTLAACALVTTLAIKEDQSLVVGFVALVAFALAIRGRDRTRARFAAIALVACVATFVTFFTIVRPLAGAHGAWGPTHFYAARAPALVAPSPWGRPAYVLEALVPLAFVPLASPAIVFALPGFFEVTASRESIVYTMGQHYAAVWIGYVLVAFACAIARIGVRSPRRANGLVRASLVLSLLVLALASPTHWGHYLRARDAHDVALDRALAALPRDANVGTLEELYAHLGFDSAATLGLDRAPRYALFDTTLSGSYVERRWRPVVVAGVRDGSYRLVRFGDGIELYERGGPVAAGTNATCDGCGTRALATRARTASRIARRRRNE